MLFTLVRIASAQPAAEPFVEEVPWEPAPAAVLPLVPSRTPKPGSPEWETLRVQTLELRADDLVAARLFWVDRVLAFSDVETRRPPKKVGGAPADQDSDGDGVVDYRDLCPTLAEDHLDRPIDGCPDDGRFDDAMSYPYFDYLAPYVPSEPALAAGGDADGDGLADSWDACLAEREDLDGFDDGDGCPEPDNDGDGVGDGWDACPFEPETPNGVDDGDGCPDGGAAQAWTAPAPMPAPVAAPSIDQPMRSGVRNAADVAVVIGLEDYAFAPDVPYARRDAQAFADWLVYTRGIPLDRVRILTQGGREYLVEEVRQAGLEVGAGGTVWVYYAGHGAADPVSRERILLGDDFRADPRGFASRGVPVSELERLAAAGGGRPVVVLDTCFAGVGRGGADLIAGTRFAVPTYATTKLASAVQWNAAGPNELSGPIDSVQHGAFTYWVVGALRGWADGELDGRRDGDVTGEEAQAYVSRKLRAAQVRDQRPVWLGPSDVVLASGATEQGPGG